MDRPAGDGKIAGLDKPKLVFHSNRGVDSRPDFDGPSRISRARLGTATKPCETDEIPPQSGQCDEDYAPSIGVGFDSVGDSIDSYGRRV